MEYIRQCTDKDAHMYEPVYDENLEKEFTIETWRWHRKLLKQKIYKKHVCSFCGHTIRIDDNDAQEQSTANVLEIRKENDI